MNTQTRIDIIRQQLVGAWRDGVDVGEVLVLAAVGAQRWLRDHPQRDEFGPLPPADLTSNREGSWEAAILRNALESGGAYLEDGQQ